MKRRLVALLAVALISAAGPATTERRVFSIRCVDDGGRVLYETDVEGPPSTDFDVVLHDDAHEVEANFVNEPLPGGGVDARVHLRSRRAYGISRNGLPLWEEDEQRHRLAVRLDQEIEMLPFGTAGNGGLLKLTITPHAASASAAGQPLHIRIGHPAPNGSIQVNARLEPHWFHAVATLVRAGSVIARGEGRLFAGERGAIVLRDAAAAPLATIQVQSSSVPGQSQLVAFEFTGAWTGAGIAPLGEGSTYVTDPNTQLSLTFSAEGNRP